MTDDCAFARHGAYPNWLSGDLGALSMAIGPARVIWTVLATLPKPDRLRPNQLAWCAANVPGFRDFLAPTTGIYEEAQC